MPSTPCVHSERASPADPAAYRRRFGCLLHAVCRRGDVAGKPLQHESSEEEEEDARRLAAEEALARKVAALAPPCGYGG